MPSAFLVTRWHTGATPTRPTAKYFPREQTRTPALAGFRTFRGLYPYIGPPMTEASLRRLWRYPVKSMGGEDVSQLIVGPGNVVGDRAYALIESESGQLVSGKRHGALVGCTARFLSPPETDKSTPPVEVTFPDGTVVTDDAAEVSRRASALLGVEVRLVNHLDKEAEPVLALGAPQTFADFAPVHVVAAGDLDRLAEEHPAGEWDLRRFRPNVLIDDAGLTDGADDWLGCDIHLGPQVVVHAVMPTPRCVMTTLAQAELPRDREILRTLVRMHSREVPVFGVRPCVGCYAEVVRPGVLRRGDPVRVERVEARHGVLAKAVDAVAAKREGDR
jgi:uncharacterized protein